MNISFWQKGGVFDFDHRIELTDDKLRATERGELENERTLSAEEVAQVIDLVANLAAQASSYEAGELEGVSDSMYTELVIDEDGEERMYSIRSGDDSAPAELWELLALLGELAQVEPPPEG